jgi:CRP-like cAMP-binding protein
MNLESIPMFRHLSPAELDALRLIAQERKFAAGREIVQAGAPGDGVYFVKDGYVEISAGQGNTRVFTRLGPAEIFGEMAIIEDRPRSATVKAVMDTEVYFLPRNEILAFLEHSPGLKQALLLQICQRLREFNQVHVRELVQSEHLAMIGRLVQGIVHDLRGPLSIINLSVELLGLDETVGETRVKTQSRIRKQVVRISDLVGDIPIMRHLSRNWWRT